MTLVITEFSKHGIAMVADSAVTKKYQQVTAPTVTPNAAKKLQYVPYLNAGLSCWGKGQIAGMPTDVWLADFINTSSSYKNLSSFATNLADALTKSLETNPDGVNSRIGVHLCGFEQFDNEYIPSFFHIHDGRSEVLAGRGIQVDGKRVNANHDMPPECSRKHLEQHSRYLTRNGDFQLYAKLFGL